MLILSLVWLNPRLLRFAILETLVESIRVDFRRQSSLSRPHAILQSNVRERSDIEDVIILLMLLQDHFKAILLLSNFLVAGLLGFSFGAIDVL